MPDHNDREMLLQSIEDALISGGIEDAEAVIHGVYSDDQGMQ